MSAHASDLWVFGYGSLMWRPDFPYLEAHAARLTGWHRSFCIVSRHYRGTDERPGLVLGLQRGGVCDGRVFKIDAGDAHAVLGYLRRREQISGVYREAHVPVALRDGSGARHVAVTFLAEPAHPSFIPYLHLRRQAHIVSSARGKTGSNLDYLIATLEQLRGFGIREAELERILVTLGPVRARAGRGLPRSAHTARVMPDWPRRPVLRLAQVKRFTHRAHLGNARRGPRAGDETP